MYISLGLANFYNLQLSKPGKAPIKFTVTSTPNDYVLTEVIFIDARSQAQNDIVGSLSFNNTYTTLYVKQLYNSNNIEGILLI